MGASSLNNQVVTRAVYTIYGSSPWNPPSLGPPSIWWSWVQWECKARQVVPVLWELPPPAHGWREEEWSISSSAASSVWQGGEQKLNEKEGAETNSTAATLHVNNSTWSVWPALDKVQTWRALCMLRNLELNFLVYLNIKLLCFATACGVLL